MTLETPPLIAGLAKAELCFHRPPATCLSTLDTPLLYRHLTSVGVWAPLHPRAPPASLRMTSPSLRCAGIWPCLPLTPPITPPRTTLAFTVTGQRPCLLVPLRTPPPPAAPPRTRRAGVRHRCRSCPFPADVWPPPPLATTVASPRASASRVVPPSESPTLDLAVGGGGQIHPADHSGCCLPPDLRRSASHTEELHRRLVFPAAAFPVGYTVFGGD